MYSFPPFRLIHTGEDGNSCSRLVDTLLPSLGPPVCETRHILGWQRLCTEIPGGVTLGVELQSMGWCPDLL